MWHTSHSTDEIETPHFPQTSSKADLERPQFRHTIISLFLRVMKKEITNVQRTQKKEFKVTTNDEKDILLDAIVSAYPTKFLAVVKDDNLVIKAFVEQCVNYDVLRRIPHTDTIYYGDNVKIGNSVNEAVMFLKDEKNLESRQQIKARLTAAKQ